jgi:hypothetical protein
MNLSPALLLDKNLRCTDALESVIASDKISQKSYSKQHVIMEQTVLIKIRLTFLLKNNHHVAWTSGKNPFQKTNHTRR